MTRPGPADKAGAERDSTSPGRGAWGFGVAFVVNKSSSSTSVYGVPTAGAGAFGVAPLVLFEADRDETGVSYELAYEDEAELF